MRLIRSVVLGTIMVAGLVGAPATAAMGNASATHVTIASAISGEGTETSTKVADGKKTKSRVVWLKTRRAAFMEEPSSGADRKVSTAAIGYKMTVVPAKGPWLQVDDRKFIHRKHVVSNERKLWRSPAFARLYAWRSIPNYKGWGSLKSAQHIRQYRCLKNLWNRESGWRVKAQNRYSGAYGIPQALPGRKMAKAGHDWRYNPKTQIKWGLGYIKSRYGSPCGAWGAFQSQGWY